MFDSWTWCTHHIFPLSTTHSQRDNLCLCCPLMTCTVRSSTETLARKITHCGHLLSRIPLGALALVVFMAQYWGHLIPVFFYWRGGALCAGRVVEPLEVAGGKKAACLSDKRMDTLCREAYQSTYSSKRASGLTAVQHVELTSSATTTRKFRSPSRSERTHTANSASTLHVTCTQLVQLT